MRVCSQIQRGNIPARERLYGFTSKKSTRLRLYFFVTVFFFSRFLTDEQYLWSSRVPK